MRRASRGNRGNPQRRVSERLSSKPGVGGAGHSANLGIGLARMTMGPVMAQGQAQSEQSENAQRTNDNKDWGWLGLLGLLGLAGLRRRRDPDLHRDATSAKPGSGVYNR